jgi:hypothetical protein
LSPIVQGLEFHRVKDWNRIPADIKNIAVTGKFKEANRRMRAAPRR